MINLINTQVKYDNSGEYEKKKQEEFRLGIIEIGDKIKEKFGEGKYKFGIDMGNYTSGEYGSYNLTFYKDDYYYCNVIWDIIFNECKIIVLNEK
jgi:hypothetical protein